MVIALFANLSESESISIRIRPDDAEVTSMDYLRLSNIQIVRTSYNFFQITDRLPFELSLIRKTNSRTENEHHVIINAFCSFVRLHRIAFIVVFVGLTSFLFQCF